MRDRNVKLGSRNRASQRRVCVAVDEHGIGFFIEHDALQRNNHAPRHLTLRAAVNAEGMLRLANAEFFKKNVGHVTIEMLASVDENLDKALAFRNRTRQRRGLNELRPRADHRQNLSAHVLFRPTGRLMSGVSPHFRDELRVLHHAAKDRVAIFARPLDGASQAIAVIDGRRKTQFVARFRRIAEAMTRMVPVSRRL